MTTVVYNERVGRVLVLKRKDFESRPAAREFAASLGTDVDGFPVGVAMARSTAKAVYAGLFREEIIAQRNARIK